jgi:hypothetical protein
VVVIQKWRSYSVNKKGGLEWRAGLSDIILKGDHPRTITAKSVLIWFSGFRGEDLNVICPPFKMAAVTTNRNFFNCPLLL